MQAGKKCQIPFCGRSEISRRLLALIRAYSQITHSDRVGMGLKSDDAELVKFGQTNELAILKRPQVEL